MGSKSYIYISMVFAGSSSKVCRASVDSKLFFVNNNDYDDDDDFTTLYNFGNNNNRVLVS